MIWLNLFRSLSTCFVQIASKIDVSVGTEAEPTEMDPMKAVVGKKIEVACFFFPVLRCQVYPILLTHLLNAMFFQQVNYAQYGWCVGEVFGLACRFGPKDEQMVPVVDGEYRWVKE